MCIIVYKPKNIDFPEKEIFDRCATINRDGIGIGIKTGKEVLVIKGLTDVDQLIKTLDTVGREWLKKLDVVIHFRLASRGKVKQELTHPFVCGEQPQNLVYTTKKPVLFHNGTIQGFGDYTKSDTLECAEWLGLLLKKGLRYTDIVNILKKIGSGDRFLLMSPRKIMMIGSWVQDNNIFYSNTGYKSFTYSYHWWENWFYQKKKNKYKWDLD